MTGSYDCEVFAADALRVTWGINEGAVMAAPASLQLGDTYLLSAAARPLALRLTVSDGTAAPRLAGMDANSTTLCALTRDAPVVVHARLRLMSADGDSVNVLLLGCCGHWLVLPLNPLRLGGSFTLIEIDREACDLRVGELVTSCFAAGTRVTLGDGSLRPVEQLVPGDLLRTRDHGAQTLRWVGRVTRRAQGVFAPVVFPVGSLGNLGALSLGPLQRIFLYQRGEKRLGTRPEVLLQARCLVDGTHVIQRETGYVDYFSLVFDMHQIIYAEGVPVESLLVSRATLDRLPDQLAGSLADRFPHLDQHAHFAEPVPDNLLTPDQRAAILRQKGV
ncbi:MAG: Hint domain-containing protein [Roseinatronobacter sp.]